MDYTQLSSEIKNIIEQVNGCFTKTTLKKGAGFVPYNRYNLKWGQVDVNENRVRIVLDLYPGRYSMEEVSSNLLIPVKNKGERKTGMFLKLTDKMAPYFDAIEISLHKDYFDDFTQEKFVLLMDFIRMAAKESSFKSISTSH